MKIFLTGHTGFIGGWLKSRLEELGYFVETDLRMFDKENWHRVIHLAAKTSISWEFDADIFDANVVFTHRVMQTPCKLIYASSCSAMYMTNPYAYTKRYAEVLGERHGNAIGLRFFNVYGPNNNKGIVKFLLSRSNGDVVMIGGPELIRDYIYVYDVVDWVVRLIEKDFIPGVIDVGTGVGTRTYDLVQIFERLTNQRFKLKFTTHGRNEPAAMVARNVKMDAIGLEEGLRQTISHYKKNLINA